MSITLKFAVCGNTETTSNLHEICDEAADAKTRAVCDALSDLPFVGWEAVDVDSHYPNWHGGKYAHQAKMHGNEVFGIAVCTGAIVTEIDDEGEEVETRVNWKNLSAEDRGKMEPQIWAAIELGDVAADKVQAEHEAAEAKFAAESEADDEA